MAVRAGHQAFANRVMGTALQLGALLHVAPETHVGLGDGGKHTILAGMYIVTGRAWQFGEIMRAAPPVHACSALVARQTSLVLRSHRRFLDISGHAIEYHSDRNSGLPPVFRAGPVAAFTVMVGKRCARVGAHGMRRLQNLRCRVLIVAAQATERPAGSKCRITTGRIACRLGTGNACHDNR